MDFINNLLGVNNKKKKHVTKRVVKPYAANPHTRRPAVDKYHVTKHKTKPTKRVVIKPYAASASSGRLNTVVEKITQYDLNLPKAPKAWTKHPLGHAPSASTRRASKSVPAKVPTKKIRVIERVIVVRPRVPVKKHKVIRRKVVAHRK